MPTFQCGNCQKSIRVPDAYVGKRVRCPGCEHAQRVPEPSLAGESAMDSIAALGLGDSAVGVRKLQQILIGCGACQKTIRLSSRTMGKTAPCPSCKTMLKVDRFDLSKTRSDLVDMSHLELETANLLLDDASSHGSTLGGSSIQLDGTGGGTGYALNDTSMGSSAGAEASDSQSQMRELRALNDLKHSGAISNDEYKRRKSEIYSGRSLAIQAMSRSADGSGPARSAPAGHQTSLIPGPVKKLMTVAVLGIGAYVLWTTVLQEMLREGQDIAGNVAENPPVGPTAKLVEDSETAEPVQSLFAGVPEDSESPGPTEDQESTTATAGLVPAAELATSVDPQATEDAPAVDQTLSEVHQSAVDDAASVAYNPDTGEAVVVPVPQEVAVTEKPVRYVILDWPSGWPDYTPRNSMAIAKACDTVKQINVAGSSAMIGVALGPAVDGFEDPQYVAFQREMQGVMTTAAMSDGMSDKLNLRSSNKLVKAGTLKCHRQLFTFSGIRDKQVTILTGVQDGQSVAYWFVGSRKAYSHFLEVVGLAVLGPRA